MLYVYLRKSSLGSLNLFARTFKMLESACGVVIYLYSVLPIKSTTFYMQFEMNILCELEMYLKLERVFLHRRFVGNLYCIIILLCKYII